MSNLCWSIKDSSLWTQHWSAISFPRDTSESTFKNSISRKLSVLEFHTRHYYLRELKLVTALRGLTIVKPCDIISHTRSGICWTNTGFQNDTMDIPKLDDVSSPNVTIYEPDLIPNARTSQDSGANHDMRRKFTLWSILGEGFSLTNSWFGISSALITGIDSGGPALFVYGIPLVAFVSVFVGCSLSELASAMPNAAGQHFWVMELAPKRYARPLSFVTGYCAWAGSLFASASVSLAVASAAVGCWQLNHSDLWVIKVQVVSGSQS